MFLHLCSQFTPTSLTFPVLLYPVIRFSSSSSLATAMEKNETSANASSVLSHSSSSPSSSPIPGALIPCAACKILRRKCTDTCLLAPHFPPDYPLNFAAAHKVFGASNVIKLLQELPERQRDDAVKSVVYEAKARVRDPVYGSAGIVFELQKRVVELKAQVAMAEAELFAVRSQQANLLALLCMKTAAPVAQGGGGVAPPPPEPCFDDDGEQEPAWEQLLSA